MKNGQAQRSAGSFVEGATLRSLLGSYEELREQAAFWQLETTQLVPGRYRGRLEAVYTANTQLAFAHHGLGTRIGGRVPDGTAVLLLKLSSSPRLQFRGSAVGQTDLIVQDAREGMDFSFRDPLDILSVAVSRSLLERHAERIWQAEAGTAFCGLVPFQDVHSMQRAKSKLCEVLKLAFERPGAPDEPDLWSRCESGMLDSLLCGLREPRPPEESLARRWIARRAAGVLHEHCREDLSIGDLCEAVGASRRTIHLGFLEVYGVPPMKYLRALRLCGVKREMEKAGARRRPVTEVATSWGFSHLGRFAASYREFFGELPSDARARPE